MSDDYNPSAPITGEKLAADDIGGVKVPRVKLQSGPDNTAVDVSIDSPLPVSANSRLDIARGVYPDQFSIHNFGHNDVVPNGTFADIWAYGPTDATYNWPTTDEKFRVKAGGNVNDTALGTGARTMQILYLDASGNRVQDTLTLAGASVSDLTSVTGRRVLSAWVDTSGTLKGSNIGVVTIENETAGNVVAHLPIGKGETQLSMYTIPLGYTGYLTEANVSVAIGTNKDADVKMWQRPNAYVVAAPFGAPRIVHVWDKVQGSHNRVKFDAHVGYPALTDLWMEAKGNGAATEVDVSFDLICVKD